MSETVPTLTQHKYGKGRIQIQMLIILLIYSFFNYKLLFIYLLLVVPGLHCCSQTFSSCSELGLFFFLVYFLLKETDKKNRLTDMGRGEERVRGMERITWKLTLPYVK